MHSLKFIRNVNAIVSRKHGRVEPQWSEREELAAVNYERAEEVPIDAELDQTQACCADQEGLPKRDV